MTDSTNRTDARSTDAVTPVEPGSDAMHRAIIETAASPFVVLDAAGNLQWCGETIEALTGRPAASVLGHHFLDLIHPSSHDGVIAEYSQFVSHDHARQAWVGPPVLVDILHADGSRITCEVSAATGSKYGIDGLVVQIRRWAGTALLYAAVDALAAGAPLHDVLADLGAIVEHSVPDSVVFVAASWDGARFDVVAAAPGTPPALRGLGTRIAEIPERAWRQDDGMPCSHEDIAHQAGLASCWSIPVTVRGDSHPSAALVLLRPVDAPPPPHNTSVARVTTLIALAIESDRNRRAWRRSATTDQLTELPNRTGLEEWLRAREAVSPNAAMAVLFCDVDGFKLVNDELGHAMGDRTLQILAERLRRCVRDDDLVCRWGGDEFVIACADADAAERLADRLIAAVGEPIGLDERTAHVGLSVGVSYGTFATPLDDLLRDSDRALLDAKSNGRNCFVVCA